MPIVKAISIKQPWANMIATGVKTIETRTWATKHRGPLLIVSSKRPNIEPAGCAVAIVDVVGCSPMTTKDEPAAGCPVYENAQAWVLANVRRVKPFPVKGQLGIYEVELPEGVKGIKAIYLRTIEEDALKPLSVEIMIPGLSEALVDDLMVTGLVGFEVYEKEIGCGPPTWIVGWATRMEYDKGVWVTEVRPVEVTAYDEGRKPPEWEYPDIQDNRTVGKDGGW